MEPIRLSDGSLLLDATTAMTASEVRELQTELAEWRIRGNATVHVAGTIESNDLIEELDSLGRRTVRLNIGTLIVVGESALAMHRAAEHEGSWDGESLPVSNADSAYDELTRLRGDGVVILVTGSTDGDLPTLVERLKESQ